MFSGFRDFSADTDHIDPTDLDRSRLPIVSCLDYHALNSGKTMKNSYLAMCR